MPKDIQNNRRRNLKLLAKQFGGLVGLAKHLNKSPGQLSHLIGINATKNIGDKLAYGIERTLGLEPKWLDAYHKEEETSYEEICVAFSNPPLLTDEEVLLWIKKTKKALTNRKPDHIRTSLKLSKYAFAILVPNDIMQAPGNISFPCQSTVLVEPELPLSNNDNVVICIDPPAALQVRQITIEGSRKYLKPLNPLYPIVELTTNNYIICGIVQQIIITLAKQKHSTSS